jgi:hypothetical protein
MSGVGKVIDCMLFVFWPQAPFIYQQKDGQTKEETYKL